MTILVIFFTVDSAFANTGYGIFTLLPYISIVPFIYLFLKLGGIYLIKDRRKRYRRIILLLVFGYIGVAVLALVIAVYFGLDWLMDFGEFSMIAVIPFFGVLIGGFMIYLGIRSLTPNRPAYLEPVHPLRMIVSGIALVAVVFACLFWMNHQITESKKERISRERDYLFEKVYEAQMEYFTENSAFSKDPVAIGIDKDRLQYYLLIIYQYEFISADEAGFLFRIWGNIDRDPNLDIWEQTEQSPVPYCIFDDEVDKGVQIDPHDPKRYSPKVR